MTTLRLLVDALLFKWENLTLKTSYPYYHERQASPSKLDFESISTIPELIIRIGGISAGNRHWVVARVLGILG